MGNLIVLIDLKTNLFEEWAVIRHSVLPERQPGDAIRVKLKRYECEASTGTEDPGDLDERDLLSGTYWRASTLISASAEAASRPVALEGPLTESRLPLHAERNGHLRCSLCGIR